VSLGQADRLPSDVQLSTEKALRVVYSAILPNIVSRSSPGWGPGPLSTERSWDFFVGLAEELGEWPQRLADGQDHTGASVRRVERAHREEAAGELVTLVRRMPTPVRVIVECRSCGTSWRRITKEFPDRAYFSIMEDWRRAVATLGLEYHDLVRRII